MTRRQRIFLYIVFGFFVFGLSLMLTFPWGVLGKRLETEFAMQQPGSALTINKIGPSLPLGIYLGDVVYEPPPEGENQASVSVESIKLHPAWLKLLTGKLGASFALRLFGGKVDGTVWRTKESQNLDVTLKNINLEDSGTLEKLIGVDMEGTISGKVAATVAMPAAKPATDKMPAIPSSGAPQTDATIKLAVDSLRVKGGKIMGFTVPATDLGSPDIDLAVVKNEAKIENLKIKSSDIEASVTGSLSLRPNVMQSLVRGSVKIRPSDDWLRTNPTIKGALSLAGPLKKPDGSIELPLSGTLAKPLNLPGMRF